MEILKLYISKKTEFKKEDLCMRWKYNFLLDNQKIGEILVFHDVKDDDLFVNIGKALCYFSNKNETRINIEQLTLVHWRFA